MICGSPIKNCWQSGEFECTSLAILHVQNDNLSHIQKNHIQEYTNNHLHTKTIAKNIPITTHKQYH